MRTNIAKVKKKLYEIFQGCFDVGRREITTLDGRSAIVAGLDDPENLRKYREFLCSGGTDYPIALLEKAGVNFDTAVETCMQEFAKALEEFRELTEEK